MNNKKLLLTGARSTVALELARRFKNQGWEVHATDSWSYALTRSSWMIRKFHQSPPPKQETQTFLHFLRDLDRTEKFDLIIPTAEEIFYVSLLKDELKDRLFCMDFTRLSQVHSKWAFIELCKKLDLSVPKTIFFESEMDRSKIGFKNWVAKPVYSRFASRTLFSEDFEQDSMIDITASATDPWIAQDKIQGLEYCSYTWCEHGKIERQVLYTHHFTAGRGAGISFEPTRNENIERWIEVFVTQTGWHGQLCFDFIVDSNGTPFAIECNPRGTSGCHLLGYSALDEKNGFVLSRLALLVYGTRQFWINDRWKFWLKKMVFSKDCLWSCKDPIPYFFQLYSFMRIIVAASLAKCTSLEWTTFDIQYDGQNIEG